MLIAEGFKPLEFRGRRPPGKYIGRRIAIHAAARKVNVDEVRDLLLQLQTRMPGVAASTGLVRHAEAAARLAQVILHPRELPLGSIICTAVLGEPLRNAELAARMGVDLVNDSDRHQHTNWGWPLSDIERVEPMVPARGMQCWWEWTPA